MPSTSDSLAAAPDRPDHALGQLLARDDYVRTRLAPRWRDLDYLILKDLRDLVAHCAPQAQGRLFDYGCGAAPYQSLFTRCSEYVKADVTPGPHIDRLLDPNGLTNEPSGRYDVVLSTQVLEHVKDPASYVQECFRLLRPGGKLILSTHGMVEEHGCPYDFHRWTSRGLENLASNAGFKITESVKFTTELRGAIQFLHHFSLQLRCPNGRALRYFLAAVRRGYNWICLPFLNCCADRLAHQAIVPGSGPASLYLGICIVAEKPAA